MKITLPHYTTQQEAIRIIDAKANELMGFSHPAVTIVDPKKSWDNNILRFSFGVKRLFLNLELSGLVIVTDQEVIGEGEVPGIVTTFFSEETIKSVIREQFNRLFNIR
ncbi:MAG: hypothetical protein WCW26_05445 [Candidatus Buchananbacteria bacterium]